MSAASWSYLGFGWSVQDCAPPLGRTGTISPNWEQLGGMVFLIRIGSYPRTHLGQPATDLIRTAGVSRLR